MLTESEMETPVFAPLAVGLEYCVRVKWPSGAEARINHFAAPQDAQRWIERESKNWLRNRMQMRSRPPSSAAFREARLRAVSLKRGGDRAESSWSAAGQALTDAQRPRHDRGK